MLGASAGIRRIARIIGNIALVASRFVVAIGSFVCKTLVVGVVVAALDALGVFIILEDTEFLVQAHALLLLAICLRARRGGTALVGGLAIV